MELGLEGRVAVVTGGSAGIGRAVGEALAAEGVHIGLLARGEAALETAAKQITEAIGARAEVLATAADVTRITEIEAAMAQVADRFGRLDILVNGAAYPAGLVRGGLEEASPERLLEDIDVKVVGYLRCAKAAVPYMKRNRFGRIINIGGLTGRSSKHLSGMRNVAICHLTKTLSDQLGRYGITVNVVHPGVVETPHIHELYAREAALQGLTAAEVAANYAKATPIRRALQPQEIAHAIVFLASERAGAITGESLAVDGGITRGIFL